MATVILYTYTGIPQVINKVPTEVTQLTGTFRQPLSLMNPVFEISGGDVQGYLNTGRVNYVAIEGRFYYIMDWAVMPNTIIELTLHLDVLMTYKTKINEFQCMLERASVTNNNDLIDHQYPVSANRTNTIIDYTVGFDESEAAGCYVLVTSQSGYSPVGS